MISAQLMHLSLLCPTYLKSGQVGDFVWGLISRLVPRGGDLYQVFWHCVCNFCAYEHYYTKAPTNPLSTVGDF